MGLADLFGAGDNFHADPYKVDDDRFLYNPNDVKDRNQLILGLQQRQQVHTPQIGPVAANDNQEFRGHQQALISGLQSTASGHGGPSPADLQLRQGLDAQIQAQQAQAASAAGLSPGAAARIAANNIAGAQQATNAQMGIQRAGEQQQAQQALGQILTGARGQDINTVQFNAGQANQVGMANQQAQLQGQAQLDQMTQYYISQGMNLDQAQMQARQQLEALKSQNYNAIQGVNAGAAQANSQANAGILGGLVGAGGAALGGFLSK